MDLNFTAEELEFRAMVRQWVAKNLPSELSHKVHNALRLTRDDMQRWAKILGKQGWLGWGWPKQFGGPAGTPSKNTCSKRSARWPVRRGWCLSGRDGGAGHHDFRQR